jgi:hypothetical protein
MKTVQAPRLSRSDYDYQTSYKIKTGAATIFFTVYFSLDEFQLVQFAIAKLPRLGMLRTPPRPYNYYTVTIGLLGAGLAFWFCPTGAGETSSSWYVKRVGGGE